MKQENNFHVLQKRILELRSALFYDQSESVLHLPPTVVQTLDVDEVGQLWFIMPMPLQQVSEFDTSFPVQLNYFRKNAPYSLNIHGRGYIIYDPEERCNWEMLHPDLPVTSSSSILVKVKIGRAEMQEWEPEQPSPVTKVVHRVLSWLNMLDSGKTMYQFG
jgi:hypothetical protein